MEEPNAGKAGIPIVVGILVGLLASFVQSLGQLGRWDAQLGKLVAENQPVLAFRSRIDHTAEESYPK